MAGPRDGASDASAAVARRRSRGVSQSEGVASVGAVLAAGEGGEQQAQQSATSGGRARSLSNPFGALLRKVRSRGDGVAEEEEEQSGSGSGAGTVVTSEEGSGAVTPVPAPVVRETAAAAESEERSAGDEERRSAE